MDTKFWVFYFFLNNDILASSFKQYKNKANQ